MYPTSAEYKNAISKSNREFESHIIIEHERGTLELSNKDLSLGGLTYTDSTQSGSDFTIGGVVASTISFSIFNKPEYETIDFTGAIIRPRIGLKLPDNTFEYIPLGVFIVDEDKRERDLISFKAMDNMIRLGNSYSESTLSYPTSLLQIYEDICSHNGITPATVDFPNKTYTVTKKPDGEYTFRDILSYVAELSGTFSKFNRNGQLELSWYKDSTLNFTPHNRYSFKASDETVKITGIMYVETGEGDLPDTVYITGTDEYAINLTDNPLLQGGYQTVLPNILANVSGIEFRPFESEWQGDPNIRSGYKVVHETVDGKFVNTIITKSTFNYGRKSKFMGEGTSKVKRNFNGTTSKKLNEIVRRLIKNNDITKELSDIELARLNAMELMANTLGGYLIVDDEDGSIYISSTPELQEFGEYWKWGLGGFAHYKDGVVDTAITADGSIVASLLSANIITADMIRALDLSVGDEIRMGENAKISWSNVTSKPSIPDDNYITNITNNTIQTTNVIAQNLTVRAANISGTLSASQITSNLAQVNQYLLIGNYDTSNKTIAFPIQGEGSVLISAKSNYSYGSQLDLYAGLTTVGRINISGNATFGSTSTFNSSSTFNASASFLGNTYFYNPVSISSNVTIGASRTLTTGKISCWGSSHFEYGITVLGTATLGTTTVNNSPVVTTSNLLANMKSNRAITSYWGGSNFHLDRDFPNNRIAVRELNSAKTIGYIRLTTS